MCRQEQIAFHPQHRRLGNPERRHWQARTTARSGGGRAGEMRRRAKGAEMDGTGCAGGLERGTGLLFLQSPHEVAAAARGLRLAQKVGTE